MSRLLAGPSALDDAVDPGHMISALSHWGAIVSNPNSVEDTFRIDAIAACKVGRQKAPKKNDLGVPQVIAIRIVDQKCLTEYGPASCVCLK